MKTFLFLIFLISLVSGIIVNDEGGKSRRRGGGRKFHDSSDSSSSEEHGGGHHNHGENGGGRPRPPPSRPSGRCQDGWMTFNRTGYTWCVKVFYQDLNWDAAQTMCQSQGATLTGLQTAQERLRIADAGRALIFQNGGVPQTVWIGARRKATCPNKPSCEPNLTFDWTDGRTTGVSGFFFAGLEPSATLWNPFGVQSCIQLLPSLADNLQSFFGYNHGALDDIHCHMPQKMYACGKVAA